MYMFLIICGFACLYAYVCIEHMNVFMYECTCASLPVYMSICLGGCIYIYVYTSCVWLNSACMYICDCGCIGVRLYECVCKHVFMGGWYVGWQAREATLVLKYLGPGVNTAAPVAYK